eukprot:1058326_1
MATPKQLFSFILTVGTVLLLFTFLSTVPVQDNAFNLSQHDHFHLGPRTHTITKEQKKTFARRFGSFIGIPNFYVKHAHRFISPNRLSICSFCSLDILRQAQTLATNYKSGPLSLAVYIDRDFRYHSIARKTALHQLFYDHFHNISTPYGLTIGLLFINKSSRSWRHLRITSKTRMDWKLPYNALRNLAEHQVRTKWLMTVDVDFELFSSTIHSGLHVNEMLTTAYPNSHHAIFIVPAFAFSMNSSYIQDGTSFNNLTHTELMSFIPHQILPFKYDRQISRIFQECTDYSKWYTAKTDYTLLLDNSTRCDMRYEPFYIMNSIISRQYAWDSRFVGRHLDKIQRMMSLRYLNFTGIVLRDMFMIHVQETHSHPISNARGKYRRRHNNCLLSEQGMNSVQAAWLNSVQALGIRTRCMRITGTT